MRLPAGSTLHDAPVQVAGTAAHATPGLPNVCHMRYASMPRATVMQCATTLPLDNPAHYTASWPDKRAHQAGWAQTQPPTQFQECRSMQPCANKHVGPEGCYAVPIQLCDSKCLERALEGPNAQHTSVLPQQTAHLQTSRTAQSITVSHTQHEPHNHDLPAWVAGLHVQVYEEMHTCVRRCMAALSHPFTLSCWLRKHSRYTQVRPQGPRPSCAATGPVPTASQPAYSKLAMGKAKAKLD